MALAYFLAASLLNSSDLAPVQTILPDVKMRAVVLGSLIRIITAANLLGLYSAFRQLMAMVLRSSLHRSASLDEWLFNIRVDDDGVYKTEGNVSQPKANWASSICVAQCCAQWDQREMNKVQ